MQRLVVAFTVVILLLGISLGVLSATITVPDDYPTIQAAIDAAQPGDTVYIRTGVFEEGLVIEKDITLQGGGEVTVRAAYWRDPVIKVSAGVVSLEALTVEQGWYGIEIWNSAQVTIVKCTIKDNRVDGIVLLDSAQATVENCTIMNNQWRGIWAWRDSYVTGSGNQMIGNGCDLAGNIAPSVRVPLRESTEEEICFPSPKYTTLQEAVDALVSGGILLLEDGEYEAGVTIEKELTIRAKVGAKPVLRARSKHAPVFSLISNACLILESIVMIEGSDGLVVGGNAQTTVRNCTIQGNSYGVVLLNVARATIEKCTIQGNESDGLRLSGSALATVQNSAIKENGCDGIVLSGSTWITAQDCVIQENQRTGAGLFGSAQAIIQNCTIQGNGSHAIQVGDSAQATIESSTIQNNGNLGIGLWDTSQATVGDCIIRKNKHIGIQLSDFTQAAVINCTICENHWGIGLKDSAQVTIQECSILENERPGIWLLNSAQATVTRCIIQGNLRGIGLQSLAQAMIQDCIVQKNKRLGVWLQDSSQAEIKNCTIRDNALLGMVLKDSARATVIDCTIADSIDCGVLIADESLLHMEGVEIYGSRIGIATYTKECGYEDVPETFAGKVTGSHNHVYNNIEGDLCPPYSKSLWLQGFLKEQ